MLDAKFVTQEWTEHRQMEHGRTEHGTTPVLYWIIEKFLNISKWLKGEKYSAACAVIPFIDRMHSDLTQEEKKYC